MPAPKDINVIDEALLRGAKNQSLNRPTGLGYTQNANDIKPVNLSDQLVPTIGRDTGVASNYSRPSSTYADNPKLAGLFSDESDLLSDFNIGDRYANDWFNNYSRFGFIDPYNTTKHTKEYLFFTRPDLNLVTTMRTINPELQVTSSFFADAIDRYYPVVEQLQLSAEGSSNPLSPLLSNAVNSSLDLPGISANTIETGKNVYQTMISYRGTSMSADQDYEFNLEFRDSKFLDVYMYFKMYDEYERLKWLGQVSPPKLDYIKKKILHDQFSIYKIVTAEDGMTILYFARAVGVYPISVPRDALSNIDGEVTFSVSFKAQFVYDMDPRILVDLNRITANYRKNMKDLKLFNMERKQAEGTWAACPYIVRRANTDNDTLRRNKYYLLWAK